MMSLLLLMQYLRLTVVTSRCVMERIDRLHLKGMIIIGLRHDDFRKCIKVTSIKRTSENLMYCELLSSQWNKDLHTKD